ncbi:MAG: DUF1874 domain-containing protein [Haliscomenobacter sp.]|nr:DUF1874 domain-containing protein [Haliscomenobacter sp.]
MTVHLMNSAVMPRPGVYTCARISEGEFFDAIVDAYHSLKLKNYIGYPQNQQYIKECTGITLLLSREETYLENGDQLLVMRLRYRTDGLKGREIDPKDFEFFLVTYQTTNHESNCEPPVL